MEYDIDRFSLADANEFISGNVDALLFVDAKADTFKALVKRGMFTDFIEDREAIMN